MQIQLRVLEKEGYPIFRITQDPVAESTDPIRLKNYTASIVDKLRWAFKCHEDATDAFRRKLPGAKGMQFAGLANRIISCGAYLHPTKLDEFKNDINVLLNKLNPKDPTVKELKKLCRVKTVDEKFAELRVTGC